MGHQYPGEESFGGHFLHPPVYILTWTTGRLWQASEPLPGRRLPSLVRTEALQGLEWKVQVSSTCPQRSSFIESFLHSLEIKLLFTLVARTHWLGVLSSVPQEPHCGLLYERKKSLTNTLNTVTSELTEIVFGHWKGT